MKKIFLMFILVLLFSSLLFPEKPLKTPPPSWLLNNKKLSMNHSISFLYSSNDGSLRSLYNNYFTYKVSPQLSFIGNIGYYSGGLRTNSLGSMLQGFGFEYKVSPNLLFHFQYEGVTPIKKRVRSRE